MPMGYSFNLDGSMMYCTFAVLFIAQAYDIHLPIGTQITMLLILMLTSKGMAGVPRASLVVIAATLNQFNIPEAGLLLILGVDTFLDMGRSATNAVGNSIATRGRRQVGRRAAARSRGRGQRARARRRTRGTLAASGARLRRPAMKSRDRGRCWSPPRCWRCARGAGADARRRSPDRCPRASRADRHAGQGARQRAPSRIGYRESSIPFSYLSARDEPIGYSIELCKRAGRRDRATRSTGRSTIKWVPVTSESRIDAVVERPGRPRMRLDHQQPRAPEARRLLADDLRVGHQADGEEGLADPLVPRPRRARRSR